MKLTKKKLQALDSKYGIIQNKISFLKFLYENPEDLTLNELSNIAELINGNRQKNAAFYTEKETLDEISKILPTIKKKVIHILEPSGGIGNFLQIIIDKYTYAEKVIIDINDIDPNSIEITQALNSFRTIPDNVEINFYNFDFLSSFFPYNKYDLVIGNPPFLNLSQRTGLRDLQEKFLDSKTRNTSGFFLKKSIELGDNVIMIMPKYFLNSPDFSEVRDFTKMYNIGDIIDFGEHGFKGVLIETIALRVDTLGEINNTKVRSIPRDTISIQPQNVITSEQFPTWLLYRDDFFEKIVANMKFDVFTSFRDRQITNSKLEKEGSIRVLKSRNISRNNQGIIDIDNYDAYLNAKDLEKLTVSKYLDRDDVFLAPNMTYYPRVVRKPKGVLVNGSIAILELKSDETIKDWQLDFLNSETFEQFYRVARNYSTRSLNIDKGSVYFFGLLQKKL